MNLSHLRYISEVAKTGSITKAAQNLYMGQPNLSKAIKEMEKTMGVSIFKRTSKGVEPTEKGREIVERANAVLRTADAFEADFCSKGDRTERISVRVCGSELCFKIFEEFAAIQVGQGVSFEYCRCDRERVFEDVKSGDASFGAVRLLGEEKFPSDRFGIKGELMAEGRAFAAVGRYGSLALEEKISLNALKDKVQVFVCGVQPFSNEKNIGVGDAASGIRIVEKSSDCFMTFSSLDISRFDFGGGEIVYREIEPAVAVRDFLVYCDGKRFGSREKELIEGCSSGRLFSQS